MNKFEQLEEIMGSKGAVADALGLPVRTYYDWRRRSYSRETSCKRISAAIDNLLKRQTSPSGNVSGIESTGSSTSP